MTSPTDNDGNFGSTFDDGFGVGGTADLLLPPWERRERYGFLNGLYLTIKDVMLAPGRFFHRMPSQVGLLQPLYFAVVLGVVAAFFAWMWSLSGSSLQLFLAKDMAQIARGPFYAFLGFLFSPVAMAVGVFVKAFLLHGMLMLLGGNRLGFEATFRVATYGEAAGILALVPACGSGVGLIWTLVVTVIGLYSIHETEPWRAVLAVVLPAIICFSAIGMSVMTIILASN